MDTEQLTEIITQVLKRMYPEEIKLQNKNRALIILEDTQNQLPCLDQYKYLFEEYSVSLLAVKGADAGIISSGRFESIYTGESLPSDLNTWVGQFDQVLIPCPSLKIISKLAHIILDDKISEVIFAALQEKKQVMLGQVTEDKTNNLTAVLKTEIKKLVDKLKGYGIKELSVNKVTKITKITTNVCSTKGVISLQDVTDSIKNGKELCIGANAIITPLAMDYIREKKIITKRMG